MLNFFYLEPSGIKCGSLLLNYSFLQKYAYIPERKGCVDRNLDLVAW